MLNELFKEKYLFTRIIFFYSPEKKTKLKLKQRDSILQERNVFFLLIESYIFEVEMQYSSIHHNPRELHEK